MIASESLSAHSSRITITPNTDCTSVNVAKFARAFAPLPIDQERNAMNVLARVESP